MVQPSGSRQSWTDGPRSVHSAALSHRLASFDASDLKRVYRALHRSLMSDPELLDSDFLAELQAWLRTLATGDGVDTSDHVAWDAWRAGRAAETVGPLAETLTRNHEYAIRHRDIVARWGRFPHRNEILGRDSTREEFDFLTTPGSSF